MLSYLKIYIYIVFIVDSYFHEVQLIGHNYFYLQGLRKMIIILLVTFCGVSTANKSQKPIPGHNISSINNKSELKTIGVIEAYKPLLLNISDGTATLSTQSSSQISSLTPKDNDDKLRHYAKLRIGTHYQSSSYSRSDATVPIRPVLSSTVSHLKLELSPSIESNSSPSSCVNVESSYSSPPNAVPPPTTPASAFAALQPSPELQAGGASHLPSSRFLKYHLRILRLFFFVW